MAFLSTAYRHAVFVSPREVINGAAVDEGPAPVGCTQDGHRHVSATLHNRRKTMRRNNHSMSLRQYALRVEVCNPAGVMVPATAHTGCR
jgi:hypothetical protein